MSRRLGLACLCGLSVAAAWFAGSGPTPGDFEERPRGYRTLAKAVSFSRRLPWTWRLGVDDAFELCFQPACHQTLPYLCSAWLTYPLCGTAAPWSPPQRLSGSRGYSWMADVGQRKQVAVPVRVVHHAARVYTIPVA
jgi:hypothetical protein